VTSEGGFPSPADPYQTFSRFRADCRTDRSYRCQLAALWFWTLLSLVTIVSPLQGQTKMAVVNQPVSSATFVNIYWDSSWDSDEPELPVAIIDQVTQAVIGSSYLKGLSEYGVSTTSFAGSLLPDPHCLQKVPASVTLYNPASSTTIADFVQCEHDNGPAQLLNSGVVYNIIMPPTMMDVFGVGFCNGASNVAFHYHGLNNNLLSGPPFFTVINADPTCGDIFDNLFHEMIEAVTDPYPIDISIIPPHFNVGGMTNEIADLCEGMDVAMFLSSVSVKTPSYWSNSKQTCVNFVQRMGVIENGTLFVKEGGLTSGWVLESSNVRSFALQGDRIGVLQNDGTLFVKEGPLTALWTWESTNVKSFALEGARIGVLQNDGTVYVKEGSLDALWTWESSNVQSVALAGDRIGVLQNDGTLFVKEGSLDALWTVEALWVKSFALEGSRIGVLSNDSNGTLSVKEGPLTAGWTVEALWVKSFALAGDRIGVLSNDSNGTLSVKEGPLTAGWMVEGSNAQTFALVGNRIAVLDGSGNLSVQEGSLAAAPVHEAGMVSSFALSY
jgi:hypothetical protein